MPIRLSGTAQGRSAVRPGSAGWATAAVVFIAFAIVALANMQTGLHGDPRTTNPEPRRYAPYPPFLGVTNWPLVTSVMSAVLTVAFFGYLGMAVDPQAQPALAADRRDRSLLRRSAGPAGELGDLHGLRSPGRALPAVVAVLQHLATAGADAVVPRRLCELLRADRARPALASSPFHRTAHPPQQLARPPSASSPCSSPDSLRGFR